MHTLCTPRIYQPASVRLPAVVHAFRRAALPRGRGAAFRRVRAGLPYHCRRLSPLPGPGPACCAATSAARGREHPRRVRATLAGLHLYYTHVREVRRVRLMSYSLSFYNLVMYVPGGSRRNS
eukprot:scaffold81730_cov54-Phaeocystis_antarctica.AAC.4